MTTATEQTNIVWKFAGIMEERGSCEMCGHEIRWAYIVTSSDGSMRKVGSDCINHFVSGDELTKAERAEKRVNRAKAEWRAWEKYQQGSVEQRRELRNKFARVKAGEDRSAYIQRRVKEMANARRGFNLSLSVFDRRGDARAGWGKYYRQLIEDGKIDPYHGGYPSDKYFDYTETVRFYETIYYGKFYAEIEAKTGSNRFDWLSRKHSYVNNI